MWKHEPFSTNCILMKSSESCLFMHFCIIGNVYFFPCNALFSSAWLHRLSSFLHVWRKLLLLHALLLPSHRHLSCIHDAWIWITISLHELQSPSIKYSSRVTIIALPVPPILRGTPMMHWTLLTMPAVAICQLLKCMLSLQQSHLFLSLRRYVRPKVVPGCIAVHILLWPIAALMTVSGKYIKFAMRRCWVNKNLKGHTSNCCLLYLAKMDRRILNNLNVTSFNCFFLKITSINGGLLRWANEDQGCWTNCHFVE